jgi:hypothetical protein
MDVCVVGLLVFTSLIMVLPRGTPQLTLLPRRNAAPREQERSRQGDGLRLPGLILNAHRKKGNAGRDLPSAVLMQIVASMIEAGMSPEQAVQVMGSHLERASDHRASTWKAVLTSGPGNAFEENGLARGPERSKEDLGETVRTLSEALTAASILGIGPVSLLHAAAMDQLHRDLHRRVVSARRAGVLILLPTGLCLLPAFLFLTVIPVVMTLAIGK